MHWSKRLFPLVALIAIVALGTWLDRGERDADPAVTLEDAEARSDYYLRGVQARAADAAGRWEQSLTAERMVHFPEDELWQVQAPRLTLHRVDGADWYGKAEHGRIWDEEDRAQLLGAVEFWRPESSTNASVRIETRDVDLRPDAQYGETEAPVRISRPGTELTGVGARLYLDREHLELLSNVKGRYVPQR